MKWNQYTIHTTTQAVDLISDMLNDLGIAGVEIQDARPLSEEDTKGMFIDILPELPEDDGSARVTFYVEQDEDDGSVCRQVKEGMEQLRMFVEVGPGFIESSSTEDKDWVNNWKAFFKPFSVEDLVIKPTWEEMQDSWKGKTIIEIDPGTAFGTGAHETTQLCIRQLKKYLRGGEHVLDVGTGSGILSIAAVKLGAERALGTDIDGHAVEVALENAAVNHIDEKGFTAIAGNLLEEEALQEQAGDGCYEIAVANILAPVILELQKSIARYLVPGGIFIASGILNTKEAEVIAALSQNPDLDVMETTRQGDWVAITARKTSL